MTLLLDTSLWIDFTHTRSPAPLKQFIAPFVPDPEVAAVALHHNVVLLSFATDFEAIASVSDLRLHRLDRPA